jgi:two-component system sensor histidine kinase KdpD
LVGASLVRLERLLAGREVKVTLPPEMLMVPVDPVLMEQVLINLLENAAKYTPRGSAIEIAASQTDQGVKVSVLDEGPGIPEGQEEHIFEKFYRLEEDGRIPGSGLGLPICRAIVTAHGGYIWAERRQPKGAVFHIILPPPKDMPPAPDAADGGL